MSKPDTTKRPLPVLGTNAGRVVGGVGVLACVACCVSIPSIVAAISALGLGFLRNDRLLFHAEIVSVVILLFTFAHSRQRHGRLAPLILGLVAAATMFFGLMTPGRLAMFIAIRGACAVVAVVVWDWRLQAQCSA